MAKKKKGWQTHSKPAEPPYVRWRPFRKPKPQTPWESAFIAGQLGSRYLDAHKSPEDLVARRAAVRAEVDRLDGPRPDSYMEEGD